MVVCVALSFLLCKQTKVIPAEPGAPAVRFEAGKIYLGLRCTGLRAVDAIFHPRTRSFVRICQISQLAGFHFQAIKVKDQLAEELWRHHDSHMPSPEELAQELALLTQDGLANAGWADDLRALLAHHQSASENQTPSSAAPSKRGRSRPAMVATL